MRDAIDRALEGALRGPVAFGDVLIRKADNGEFVLCHRDDETQSETLLCRNPEEAANIAKYDDAGNYRPLKTAPNLRHGWSLRVPTLDEVRCALDHFYPGRLALFAAWQTGRLRTTPLRETLARQSGMYRIAAHISDEQLDRVIGNFCRSDGGCLRVILWRRDGQGMIASTRLPPEKFDPSMDQKPDASPATAPTALIPLLCQEGCNLLVAECRKMMKSDLE
jgi:sirohydrochlorin cobaltochelatase